MKQNQEEIEKIKQRFRKHRQRNHQLKEQAQKSGSHRQEIGGGHKTYSKSNPIGQVQYRKTESSNRLESRRHNGEKNSLGEFVRAINEAESASVLEVILAEDAFSDFFPI